MNNTMEQIRKIAFEDELKKLGKFNPKAWDIIKNGKRVPLIKEVAKQEKRFAEYIKKTAFDNELQKIGIAYPGEVDEGSVHGDTGVEGTIADKLPSIAQPVSFRTIKQQIKQAALKDELQKIALHISSNQPTWKSIARGLSSGKFSKRVGADLIGFYQKKK